ncbi:hypothetical protein DSL72_004360 [Monilinia vaccinii-corymbosi]|uniref:Uncharacterized protein n=1 Tax=Monilinia vaccinii-corymbosi TaxID=61207 RepID=A0A8A3NZ26_9HELO|nr:hypothetical protein DSL72_004360 [Monilinia vaccinii-corymbosi]
MGSVLRLEYCELQLRRFNFQVSNHAQYCIIWPEPDQFGNVRPPAMVEELEHVGNFLQWMRDQYLPRFVNIRTAYTEFANKHLRNDRRRGIGGNESDVQGLGGDMEGNKGNMGGDRSNTEMHGDGTRGNGRGVEQLGGGNMQAANGPSWTQKRLSQHEREDKQSKRRSL